MIFGPDYFLILLVLFLALVGAVFSVGVALCLLYKYLIRSI